MTTSTTDAPAPVAVTLAEDPALAGVAWRWPSADLALVLVHDVGADLDALRWLAEPLAAAGVSCLGLDLPGHGLSAGDPDGDPGPAIAAAYEALVAESAGVVAVLATGESAESLLCRALSPEPVAAVLLNPRRPHPERPTAPEWRLVPKLVISEPDAAANANAAAGAPDVAAAIIEATNAWCLRADLSRARADDDEIFGEQVASLVLKFLLEQAAFALAGRAQEADEQAAAAGAGGEGAGSAAVAP